MSCFGRNQHEHTKKTFGRRPKCIGYNTGFCQVLGCDFLMMATDRILYINGLKKKELTGMAHLKMILYLRDRAKTFAWERRVGLRSKK